MRTLDGVVTQQAGATVQGSVTTLDGDLAAFFAAFGLLLIPALILLFIGFGLAMIAAALVVAAFGARQVRADGVARAPGAGPRAHRGHRRVGRAARCSRSR